MDPCTSYITHPTCSHPRTTRSLQEESETCLGHMATPMGATAAPYTHTPPQVWENSIIRNEKTQAPT